MNKYFSHLAVYFLFIHSFVCLYTFSLRKKSFLFHDNDIAAGVYIASNIHYADDIFPHSHLHRDTLGAYISIKNHQQFTRRYFPFRLVFVISLVIVGCIQFVRTPFDTLPKSLDRCHRKIQIYLFLSFSILLRYFCNSCTHLKTVITSHKRQTK